MGRTKDVNMRNRDRMESLKTGKEHCQKKTRNKREKKTVRYLSPLDSIALEGKNLSPPENKGHFPVRFLVPAPKG